MNKGGRITTVTLFLFAALAHGDEAVTLQGRRYSGTMQTAAFAPASAKQPLPLAALHHVLFPDKAAPLPRCRLLHQLLLPGEQRLTGELLALSAKDVKFQVASGESFTLSRRHLQGIVSADGFLSRMVIFGGDAAPFRWIGRPVFSDHHAFSGKKSLLVDAANSAVGLHFPAAPKNYPRRVTWCFYDSAVIQRSSAEALLDLGSSQNNEQVTLTLGDSYYSLESGQYRLPARSGWHMVQVEIKDEAVRVFMDDFYLGSKKLSGKAQLESLRFTSPAKGSLWVDAIQYAVQWPPQRRQPGPAKLDEIWLDTGEQLFGELLAGDEKRITFSAPYGKNNYPWSDLRGIFFRVESKPPSLDHSLDVYFRSGPGFSDDRLTGSLANLDDRRLLLRHPILGELTIDRSRLRKMRFH